MGFSYHDGMFTDYMSKGYVVFEGIVPPNLIADFKKDVGRAREICRATRGDMAQRLQPLGTHDIFKQALQDYAELPALNDAIRRVIGRDDITYGNPMDVAMFFEPRKRPYCTHWHRDITAESALQSEDDFFRTACLRHVFNQVNCALFQDSSTWYVPGSHARPDTDAEAAHPEQLPDIAALSLEEGEAQDLHYCRSMPDAICLHLHPGDFALYRPNGWHIGNYSPNRIRATLHDTIWSPAATKWYAEWSERRALRADAS